MIIATGNETREHALRAIALGRLRFLSEADRYRCAAADRRPRRTDVRARGGEPTAQRTAPPPLRSTGSSRAAPKCCSVLRNIEKLAPTDVAVLLLGESGTGKELLAQAIHQHEPAGGGARLSRSTAPRSPRRCSKASCSATRKAPSPARVKQNHRQDRKRRSRHAVPRRNRRCAAADAGQAAALPAGPDRRADRRPQAGAGRRAHRLRDKPESRSADGRRAASAKTSITA